MFFVFSASREWWDWNLMDSPLPANVFVLSMFMMLRKSSSSLSVAEVCSLLPQKKKKNL
jgi:hypothetical protein